MPSLQRRARGRGPRQHKTEGADAAARSVSASVLERLKVRDSEAWTRVVRLYHPLVCAWGKQAGLQAEDAGDLAQEGCP